jgi:hypothetical protein
LRQFVPVVELLQLHQHLQWLHRLHHRQHHRQHHQLPLLSWMQALKLRQLSKLDEIEMLFRF